MGGSPEVSPVVTPRPPGSGSPTSQFIQATLLPDDDPQQPLHHCLELLDNIACLKPDLTDIPWPQPDATLYTDGSSFIAEGVRYAGAAVVAGGTVIWAQALSHGTSAQQAELIAVTQALRWGKEKTVNIYTDSRYAFATAHIHGALYKERGLLTSGGKEIRNREEILALLEAIWLPKKVAIIHCPGHQRTESEVARGNAFAYQIAKEAARKPVGPIDILPVLPPRTLSDSPVYTPGELELCSKLKGVEGPTGWIHLPDGRTLVPGALGQELVSLVHQSTHLGGTKLIELLKRDYYIPGLHKTAKEVTTGCHICTQVNPGPPVEVQIGSRLRGQAPGEHWELDFTEIILAKYGFANASATGSATQSSMALLMLRPQVRLRSGSLQGSTT
ncbi:uncharacterized protein LOC105308119, partial [Pteropus vampyrus]|uniref:Uncharacterized protein LOC105308119 n=1 Tax=Pteropus vampyrus TaxID=132908 RepID=A0A6P3RSF2_PTEVA